MPFNIKNIILFENLEILMDSLINILDDEEIISNAKKSLENKGYFIIRNALTEQNYLSCREEALSFFKKKLYI